jgi:Zn-dependent M28 family amino/carboxypeptidase
MNALIVWLAAAAAALPSGYSTRERAAARRITTTTLAAHVRFLADDLLEGRAPASRGGELALRYIAAQFERLGLVPAGDGGGWLQRFDIIGIKSEVTTPVTVVASGKPALTLRPVADSVVVPGLQQAAMGVRDADVIFVGYGITAPEQKWDDFKDVDVRGKVLLVMNNDPESDPALFAGKTRLYYGRWDYKYAEAARHGAAGVIIIHTDHSASYPWHVVQSSWTGTQFELPAKAGEPRVTLKMWATEEASRRLAALGGKNLDELRRAAEKRDFRPVPLGVKLTAAVKATLTRTRTANVLGKLPGSDKRLADELVVVSAHHDHLGMHEGGKGDVIYNGAQDNASGVAAMLNIAEAMASLEPRPKRSILFAAVAAEESGLLGSQYFCEHPVVPPGRIAANLNIDGLNIWGRTTDIGFIGLGKSTLDDVVGGVARIAGRQLAPDDRPDKGGFYRSDQFNFAKVGVPAIYLKAGVHHPGHDAAWGQALEDKYEHERYHQPSDQIDDTWNLDGAVDDVQLMTVALMRVADAPKMPEWRKGDEFEAARKRSLTGRSEDQKDR